MNERASKSHLSDLCKMMPELVHRAQACSKRATTVGTGDVVWFLGRRGGSGAGERAVGWGPFHLATRFCSLSDFPCGHAFSFFIQKSWF